MGPIDSPEPRHDGWRLARNIFLAAAVGIALWDPLRPAPEIIYERACAIVSSEPDRAKWLLQMAVADAGGDFPDAQAQLCLLAIRSGHEIEFQRLCDSLHWQWVNSESLRWLGYLAVGMRQIEQARKAYLELRSRQGPDCITGWQGLVTVYTLQHQSEQVLTCLEEITRLAPDDPHAWRQLAQAHEACRNPAAAAATYRRALEHTSNPRDEISFRHRLVARLMDAGDLTAAGEELEWLAAHDERRTRVEALRDRLRNLRGNSAPDTENVVDGPAR